MPNRFLRQFGRPVHSRLGPLHYLSSSTWRDKASLYRRPREELYRKGCLLLCGESNKRRQMRDQAPPFTEDQIYACATRIDAATVFGNRVEIVKSVTTPADADTSVFWNQIAPANEDIDGEQ